jgi:hypothetical protein
MTLKEKILIPENYDISKDEIYSFLNVDEDIDYSTYIVENVIPIHLAKNMSPLEISNWFKNGESKNYSILHLILKDKLNELKEAKEDLNNYYFNTSLITEAASPFNIHVNVLKRKVRVARVREVLKPQKALVLIPHRSKLYKYWVAKAYWWDDYGIRSRNYNKTIIKDGYEVELRLKDLYEDLGFNVSILSKPTKDHKFDFIIRKNNQELGVDVKIMNQENLAKFILSIEMWESYKKIYKNY